MMQQTLQLQAFMQTMTASFQATFDTGPRLPSLPTIDFALWKDRISEALGFLTWMEKLTLGSIGF